MKHSHIIYKVILGIFLFYMSGDIRSLAQSTDLGLRTVVIDPGHGGKDPGAPGKTSKTSEKHLVMAVSRLLGERIKAGYPDVKVVYTRNSDVFVELKERVNIAKRNKADLFISIHCNSNNSSQPYGASVHILGPKSKNSTNTKDYFAASMSVAQRENSVMLLEDDYKTSYQDFDPSSAESVISNSLLWSANYGSSLMFAAELDAAFRQPPFRESGYTGIHQDIFYLLWATNMPSVLLELGFISNPSDFKYLSTPDGQAKIADRLYDAFKIYKKNFDASMNIEVGESVPQEQEPAVIQKGVATGKADIVYGVQIMGLSRRLMPNDPSLKGLKVMIIPPAAGSKVYKYVAAASQDPAAAKAELGAVKKKFPEAFLVKIDGDSVTRVK
jgi:N-acetylmuramoyl-L-alanine amidase